MKKTALLVRSSYFIENFLTELGFETVRESDRPDLLVIPEGNPITSKLTNSKNRFSSINEINQDYQDLAMISAALVSNIPILGLGRGMLLMHFMCGGGITPHCIGHSYGSHGLTDFSGNKLTNELHSNHTEGGVISTEISKYDKVFLPNSKNNLDKVLEGFLNKSRKMLGFQNTIGILSNKEYNNLIKTNLKEII